ncbi:50S ribosomal protein L25 [Chloroflexota bacterium]
MDKIELQADTREILGKKVRFLRRQGITPVHIFGHNVESLALQCDSAQLRRVLAQTGQTGLISLKLDKVKEPRNVMVREIQREPGTGELLHIDFYQVRMEEKIRVDIPIILVGEAPALKSKENFLAQELNSLTVECLPDGIPPSVELDISSLEEVEQAIRVKDISLDEGITILNDPEQLVVRISVRRVEKVEVAAEVEAEVEDEAPEEAPVPEKEEPE